MLAQVLLGDLFMPVFGLLTGATHSSLILQEELMTSSQTPPPATLPPAERPPAYPPPTPPPTYGREPRPFGVTLLGIAFLILGGLALLWSLFVFGLGTFSTVTGTIFGAGGWAASGVSNVTAGVIGIITAIVQLVVGWGLLTLKPWAWILAIIGAALGVINGIVGMLGGGLFTLCCGLIGLLIPVGILIYLFNRDVRRAFGR